MATAAPPANRAGVTLSRLAVTARNVRAARDRIAKLATLPTPPNAEQLASLRAELERVSADACR